MSVSEVPQGGKTSATEEAEASEFAAGFKRVEAEIRAVTERELQPINLDIQGAVTTVLGALPELRALRETFAKLLGFDLARFDKLHDYALALGHAHAMYRAASGPSDGVGDLADQVAELRDVLQADAMALAKRKILDEAQVIKLRGGSGYKNVAFEVVGLVGLFRERWEAVKGRSALQLEELEHAGRRAQELVTAVGLKEQTPAVVGAASALRQRAFTLFMAAYDDARRAVLYLRWVEGDGDDIAPSLFVGHGGRPGPEVEKPQPGPAPVPAPAASGVTPPPAPAPAPGMPGAPAFVRP